ncbi:methyltransferase domain-containing protein [Rickettsiales bacterium]|nr:methyltransferase domain-containing protein [Rickettsiales bacterium]
MSEEIYTLKNVPLFEAMYGTGLISLGGYEAVDDMFGGIVLANKKLLDIGSGIGGMAHYLSEKYGAHVTGLEVHPWMAEYSKEKTPPAIKNKTAFIFYNKDGSIPLPSGSLDIVYSKGVLTNVKDKESLFKEVARILKSGGEIFLIDWLVPEENGPKYERLSLGDMSFKETKTSYGKMLKDCGFGNISFEDKSALYLGYVKSLVRLLRSAEHRNQFSEVIESDLREKIIQAELNLQDSIENKEQMSVLIRASTQ